MKSGRWNQPKS